MIYIILVFISILSLEYLIPYSKNDSKSIKMIKNFSTLFIIVGILGLYSNFRPPILIYTILIIYILSIFLNHPIQELFGNTIESFNKSLLPQTLSYYKIKNDSQKKSNLNLIYPNHILNPDPNSLKDKEGNNIELDATDLDLDEIKLYESQDFIDGTQIKNTQLEKIKSKLNDDLWDVSIENIYSNKDDKSFIPLDKYKNMRPNNIKIDQLNLKSNVKTKKKEYFASLNILGNFKWAFIMFIIFLLLLYVYDIGS